MNQFRSWVSVLVVLTGGITAAHAQPYGITPPPTCPPPCYAVAPDLCRPGFYTTNPCGTVYGPNYYVRPCFQPYQGPAGPKCPPPPAQFVTHPYARSPRDYFMYEK